MSDSAVDTRRTSRARLHVKQAGAQAVLAANQNEELHRGLVADVDGVSDRSARRGQVQFAAGQPVLTLAQDGVRVKWRFRCLKVMWRKCRPVRWRRSRCG